MSYSNFRISRTGLLAILSVLVGQISITTSSTAFAGDVLKVPEQYPTIQAAVDAVQPSDTIQVARGTFDGNVIIADKSNIRLLGRKSVINGSNTGIGIHIVDSDNVRVQGFIVQSFEAGIVFEGTTDSRIHNVETRFNDSDTPSLRDGLQLVASDHVWVTNVSAHDNGHNGITLKEGSSNNVLHNNTTNDNGQNPAVAANFGGCGIQLISSDNNHNTITANEVRRNGWGIQVGGGSNDNDIAQNRSHQNARAGLVVLDSGSNNFIGQSNATGNGIANVAPSGTFDLFDEGELDNTWRNNKGTFNF